MSSYARAAPSFMYRRKGCPLHVGQHIRDNECLVIISLVAIWEFRIRVKDVGLHQADLMRRCTLRLTRDIAQLFRRCALLMAETIPHPAKPLF
jgi:hypothetical protein